MKENELQDILKNVEKERTNQKLLNEKNKNSRLDGIWTKYDQGSDYYKLYKSLQGYNTGWSIEESDMVAQKLLNEGDFYVYYTLYYAEYENNSLKVPRIGISTKKCDQINFICGRAKNNNIELQMLPTLYKKIQEFPEGNKYLEEILSYSNLDYQQNNENIKKRTRKEM